jgi:transposase InsO family protein
MDPNLYYGLEKYLREGRIPETVSKDIGEEVEKIAAGYQIDKSKRLAKLDKNRQPYGPRIVINRHKMKETLKKTHDHPLSGHQGQETTYLKTAEVFYWPGMKKDVQEYIRTCQICQKRERKKGETPLEPIKKITLPFYQVSIDVMGPLPITLSDKRYIVVAIDHFTKWIEARALEQADAQSIVQFTHDEIICRHGTPNVITTDRGSEFDNTLFRNFLHTYQIQHRMTTAYHPQGNGQVERVNATIKNLLAKITPKNGDWSHYLSSALFATRAATQASTRFSPAELLHGYRFRHPFDDRDYGVTEKDPEIYAREELSRLQEIRTKSGEFIKKAQDRQKKGHDNKTHMLEPLNIGDQVLLYRNIVEASWSAKLQPKWEGPFLIQSIKGTTYRLRTKQGSILDKTYHRNRIRPYHGRSTHSPRPVIEIEVRQGPPTALRRTSRTPDHIPRDAPLRRNPDGHRLYHEEAPEQLGPDVLLHDRRAYFQEQREVQSPQAHPPYCRVPLRILPRGLPRDPPARERVPLQHHRHLQGRTRLYHRREIPRGFAGTAK